MPERPRQHQISGDAPPRMRRGSHHCPVEPAIRLHLKDGFARLFRVHHGQRLPHVNWDDLLAVVTKRGPVDVRPYACTSRTDSPDSSGSTTGSVCRTSTGPRFVTTATRSSQLACNWPTAPNTATSPPSSSHGHRLMSIGSRSSSKNESKSSEP